MVGQFDRAVLPLHDDRTRMNGSIEWFRGKTPGFCLDGALLG